MQLLYCDPNGVVIGWHDSEQTVAISLYGGNVKRIIPYDQPIGTLAKIGPPPVPPDRDSRPYQQPAETPQLLIAYAGQVRYETDTAGITFNAASGPIPVACDRNSQYLVGNLAQYAAGLPGSTQIDFTQAGVHYPLLASECPAMFNAVLSLIQQCRTVEAQCIADQNSPTPTLLTYDDIDAQFAGVLSKTLRSGK